MCWGGSSPLCVSLTYLLRFTTGAYVRIIVLDRMVVPATLQSRRPVYSHCLTIIAASQSLSAFFTVLAMHFHTHGGYLLQIIELCAVACYLHIRHGSYGNKIIRRAMSDAP
jgi:hypothetical protein